MSPSLQQLRPYAVFRALCTLMLIVFTLLGSGCAMFSNTVTLKTELPPRFSVFTTAHYSPLYGGVCFVPEDYAGDPEPDRKYFTSDRHPTPFTSEFEVTIGYRVADCLAALSGFTFKIDGQPATDEKAYGRSTVSVEVETFLREDEELATRIDEQVLNVRCHWRAPKPDAGDRHELQCFGVDANGQESKSSQLGVLKNRQLQGLTLRLKVSVGDMPPSP